MSHNFIFIGQVPVHIFFLAGSLSYHRAFGPGLLHELIVQILPQGIIPGCCSKVSYSWNQAFFNPFSVHFIASNLVVNLVNQKQIQTITITPLSDIFAIHLTVTLCTNPISAPTQKKKNKKTNKQTN